MTRGWPVLPGVPAAGHVSAGGYWHSGALAACSKPPCSEHHKSSLGGDAHHSTARPHIPGPVESPSGGLVPVVHSRGTHSSPAEVVQFDLEWRSTPHERYRTNMMDGAETLLASEGIEVVERFGGTDHGGPEPVCENGLLIEATVEDAHHAQVSLAEHLGRDVLLRQGAAPASAAKTQTAAKETST